MASIFSWNRPELAIDFGTANLRVIRRHEGIVFDEPSLCCFADIDTSPSLFAAGSAAQAMLDRTPQMLEVRRPLRRGVLQDIETARHLLRYAVGESLGRKRMGSMAAIIGVPADVTQAERNAMLTAARDAGLGPVSLVPEPFAAAIGAKLPVAEPRGSMIVECGAGTTEVAIVSLGEICLTRSVRIGGASLDEAIADHLHSRHKFLVGAVQAERIKRDYVEQRSMGARRDGAVTVKGRNLVSGVPSSMSISLSELDGVVEKHISQIVDVIRDLLVDTPPEISHDICSNGIMLTGGSAVTPRLREMIEEDTGLRVIIAEEPSLCVAHGLHHILQS